MNRKVPPRVLFQYEPDPVPAPEPEPDMDDEVSDFESYEEEVGEPESATERMPKFVDKEEIVGETIFEYPDNIGVMPDEVKENLKYEGMEEEIDYGVSESVKPKKSKATVTGRKPRKPMTEQQKANLAQARIKAAQVKKMNAEERKKMKAIDNEEKELLKQRKVKNLQKLREEVSDDPKPVEKVVHQHVSGLTRKDLEEAQFEAIERYETLRKQRKEEKRIIQEKEKQKRELIEKLNPNNGYRARDTSGKLVNRWDLCY
jgi:hypothetical protein